MVGENEHLHRTAPLDQRVQPAAESEAGVTKPKPAPVSSAVSTSMKTGLVAISTLVTIST